MKIEQLYDKVAATYNQEYSANVLTHSNHTANQLIIKQGTELKNILSLGVGDGAYLKALGEHAPHAHLHGLDISANMLTRAHELTQCHTYHGDIGRASELISKRDFDLITAHFINAYVPLSQTLSQSHALLQEGGLVSVLSNTLASFPKLHALRALYGQSRNPLYRFIHKHIQKSLASVFVPQDLSAMCSLVEQHGFNIQCAKNEFITIHLPTPQAMYDFFINGGWFISGFQHGFLPNALLTQLTRFIIKNHIDFPYQDTADIAIVIAKKPK